MWRRTVLQRVEQPKPQLVSGHIPERRHHEPHARRGTAAALAVIDSMTWLYVSIVNDVEAWPRTALSRSLAETSSSHVSAASRGGRTAQEWSRSQRRISPTIVGTA